jgi:hypothetical protein
MRGHKSGNLWRQQEKVPPAMLGGGRMTLETSLFSSIEKIVLG